MANYSAIAALLTSILIVVTGNGLLSTLVPLRAKVEGFSDISIGLIGSCYFIGMLVGTMATPSIVRSTGYIRAFAAFIALAIFGTLMFSIFVMPLAWLVLRGLMGFAFAGIYGVVDGWISAKSVNANRGRVYGFYQFINFAGTMLGQQALILAPPTSFFFFSGIASLFALSILPMAFTHSDPPTTPRSGGVRALWLARMSPVGAAGALCAGSANGIFWTMTPVYGLSIGLSPFDVGQFITIAVIGSTAFVSPIARLSDSYDRRKLMFACALVAASAELALWFGDAMPLVFHVSAGFVIGASAMVIYTLAISHSNDRAGADHAIIVASTMLFLYCIGAIVAPTFASWAMGHYHPAAMFLIMAVLHIALALFIVWRVTKRVAPVTIARPAEQASRTGASPP